MVIKINGKPIEVKEETPKKTNHVAAIGTPILGIFTLFVTYDAMCSVFLFYHPFPTLHKIMHFLLGGLL